MKAKAGLPERVRLNEGLGHTRTPLAKDVLDVTFAESECGLTLPSRGQLPAYGLQLPLMSNVSAQKRPQFKRSSPPCKVGESMLNTRSSSQASSVRERP